MSLDPRGGSNRAQVNVDFFKSWSPSMAYVLGFLFADGTLIDAQSSSRTQYVAFSSCDLILLTQIRKAMNSTHTIYRRKPLWMAIKGKQYRTSVCYVLRIGSKQFYQDLMEFGLRPRKSKTMKLPHVPDTFFPYFLRGYFDGDGCVHVSKNFASKDKLVVVFTSGSHEFLRKLRLKMMTLLAIKGGSLTADQHKVWRLRYRAKNGRKILDYLYQNLDLAPVLWRKYYKYLKVINTLGSSSIPFLASKAIMEQEVGIQLVRDSYRVCDRNAPFSLMSE